MNRVLNLKAESVEEEILQDSQDRAGRGGRGEKESHMVERLVLKLQTVEKQ